MEIQWSLVLYSLLMGLATGPFALLALTDACEKRSSLCKWAALVGLASIVVAGIAAFSHLIKPLNAIYMFNNLRSPMTQETILVLLTGLVAAALAALLLFNLLPGVSRRMLAWLGLALSVLSVILIAGIYLLPARPAWNTWLLPLTLLASSLANGVLLAWVLAIVVPAQQGEGSREGLIVRLRSLALPIMAAYAILAVVFLLVAAGQAGGTSRVLSGDLALPFWVGMLIVGLALPIALIVLGKKEARAIPVVAFLFLIAGGLIVRAMLFPLGVATALTTLW